MLKFEIATSESNPSTTIADSRARRCFFMGQSQGQIGLNIATLYENEELRMFYVRTHSGQKGLIIV